ncbi:MAG: hypothetical protein IJ282_02520 [Lachnospiraceae bacterium]|nr:hypothetical protein [Lachnospiraceae bacterium]
MIYYSLKRSTPAPQYLPSMVKETEARRKVSLCEPQTVIKNVLDVAVSLSFLTSLQQAEQAALSIANFLFLPIILPEQIWEDTINRYNPEYQPQA